MSPDILSSDLQSMKLDPYNRTPLPNEIGSYDTGKARSEAPEKYHKQVVKMP